MARVALFHYITKNSREYIEDVHSTLNLLRKQFDFTPKSTSSSRSWKTGGSILSLDNGSFMQEIDLEEQIRVRR